MSKRMHLTRRGRRGHRGAHAPAQARLPVGDGARSASIPPTSRPASPIRTGRCAPGAAGLYQARRRPTARRSAIVVDGHRISTKRIANGVTARVVHDVVTERGRPVEVTDDWYAQDRAGNVWYLGEATTEYENGKPVSTRGLLRGRASTAPRRASR